MENGQAQKSDAFTMYLKPNSVTWASLCRAAENRIRGETYPHFAENQV